MVKEATSLHDQQQRELSRNLEQKDKQIEAEGSALDATEREIPAAKTSLDATHELLQRMRDGIALGVIPVNRLAQAQEQAAQSERVHTQLVASLDQHAARIKGLQAEREAIIAKAAATHGINGPS